MPITPAAISGIPWHQLTGFSIYEEVAFFRVVEIIECCPRLESRSISCSGNLDANIGTPAGLQITQNVLRKIEFWLPDDCPVFQSLTLPALADIAMYFEENHPVHCSFAMELVDFCSRSKCELEKLTFSCSTMHNLEILECLKHKSCESLTDLCLLNALHNDIRMVEEELLMRLTYAEDKSEAPLCPKLSSLELVGSYSPAISPGLLGKMVCSRRLCCPEENRLKLFSLTIFEPLDEEDQTLLGTAEEDGLTLHLTVNESDIEGDDDEDTS